MKRTLVITALTFSVLLAVIFLAFNLHRTSKEELLLRFNEQQLFIAQQVASGIESYFNDRARDIQILSSFASLRPRSSGTRKMAADILPYFEYLKKVHAKALSVYDEKGTIIYSTNKNAIGLNYVQDEFFGWASKGENMGHVFVSSLIRDSVQYKKPYDFRFILAAPLYQEADDARYARPGKAFAGVISLTVDIEELLVERLAFISQTMELSQAWVIDKDGVLLFQSEHPEMILRNIYQKDEECNQCHTSFDYAERMLTEKMGSVDYELKEFPRKLAAFAAMEFENASWTVVVDAQYDKLTAFETRSLRGTLALLGGVALAFIGGSTLMYRNYRLKARAEEEAKQWREKRMLEDRIQQSEERYRRLVEHSPDAIAVQSKGRIVFVNSAGAKLLGAANPEELIGKPVLDIVHPDYREFAKDRIRQLTENGKVMPLVEEKFVRLDGTVIDVEVAAIPFSFQGMPGAQVVIRDITDRKRAEKDLQKSKEFVETVLNSVTDSISVIDTTDFRIVGVNEAFLDTVKMEEKDVIGKYCYEIIHHISKPCEPPDNICPLAETLQTGYHSSADHIHYDKDCKEIYVEVSTFPVRNEKGEIHRVVHVTRDITDRKRAAEAKAALEAQLRQSQKMEAIGTLAGGIAHDFNNILTPILGYVDMLLQDVPQGSKAYSDLQHVIKAANRAKDLVQQILTFSRQVEQERKPVQIHLIAKEALKLLRASLPATIEIRQNIDSKCGAVLADPTQIHQVLMNLCTNASHAMRESGGVLEVSLGIVEVDADFARGHSNLHEGTYVRLTVSDTGHGLDRTTMERIFEPFFTTKGVGEGTGLGLSVVHGIVVNHGGAITVESERDKGATFHVYLPRIDCDVEQDVAKDHHIPLGQERILFVDDEEEIALWGKQMLERLGYEVTKMTSSLEALETFRAQPDRFDLVITDQTMPNMAGIELARELLNIRPDVPIILITGFSEMANQKTAQKMGICEFIMKPIFARDLGKAIRRALEQEKERQE